MHMSADVAAQMHVGHYFPKVDMANAFSRQGRARISGGVSRSVLRLLASPGVGRIEDFPFPCADIEEYVLLDGTLRRRLQGSAFVFSEICVQAWLGLHYVCECEGSV